MTDEEAMELGRRAVVDHQDRTDKTTYCTMTAVLSDYQPPAGLNFVYVGEFRSGIELEKAVRRVVALFGDELAWIVCAHYEG